MEEGAHKNFYMHKVGHWIGLDTHDVGAYSDGNNFTNYEAGMVQTIEPGIYISSKSSVDENGRGSGFESKTIFLLPIKAMKTLHKVLQ